MPAKFDDQAEDQESLLAEQDRVDTAWANPDHLTPAARKARLGQLLAFFFLGCVASGLIATVVTVGNSPSTASLASHSHFQVPPTTQVTKPGPEPHPDHNEDHQWLHCGDNIDEALSRGCTFNGMMAAWIPPACDYPDLNDEYVDYLAQRRWFADPQMTKPVPNSFFDSGNYTILYSPAYHKIHCLYVWRRLGLALKKRWRWVDDSSIGDFDHPEHCVHQLAPFIEATEAEENPYIMVNGTFSIVAYPRCIIAPWLE